MRRIIVLLCMVSLTMFGHAQVNSRDLHRAFDEFRQQIHTDFEDFRQKINEEFIEFLRNPWKEFEAEEPITKPKEDEEVPPVVIPEEDKEKPVEDKPVVIEEVIEPEPVAPQPEPVAPIEEVPVIEEEKTLDFSFYGTPCKVRYSGKNPLRLKSLSPDDVANAYEILTTNEYENLLYDCLETRRNLQLCDWAYLQLLKTVAESICPKGSNESVLLLAYLYGQSGYRMRMAQDGKQLFMLFASRHIFYNQAYYTLDGDHYYGLVDHLPNNVKIADCAYPNEKSLSMLIVKPMELANKVGETRRIRARDFADVLGSAQVNQNLIAFYNDYPVTQYGENFMTRWATYAMTPIANNVKEKLYPQLQQAVEGMDELGSVSRLLNWVQTGFEYEYDDKVWGGDRAFFAEESLYYPYCDCEDRSILLSRLVRDLLGLDVLLVYYPGHLATAVGFTEDVQGDYIMREGKKYVVCDPTYIGAPVGRTMPEMDNAKAKVILLK